MTDAEKERTKLTATYLNGLAIAAAAVGGLAPAVGIATASDFEHLPVTLIVGATCLLLSLGLHFLGRAILKGLDR